jgi:hypothetical protein
MTDDDTPLRDDVLRVLTDAPEPLGIRAIAAELNLSTKSEMIRLAATLHVLTKEGALVTEGGGAPGRKFAYRLRREGEPMGAVPMLKAKASRKAKTTTTKPHQPLEAACVALEQALVALVQDPATLAVVQAYIALKAK